MYPDQNDEVVQLYLDDIIPNRFQPREVFDERALKELAVSIKEHGVIQPIIVRNVNGKYEIIAGERRYKASALAGLTKIPAIVRDLDDKESSKVALLENLQRKNLNPIEEARTYQKILEIDEMTQEELAKTMGKSQSAVANKIRLLSLPDEIQEALLKEQISERHARSLLNIPDASKQKEMLKKIVTNKMSVRSVEEEIKKAYPKGEESKEDTETIEEAIPEIKIASENAFVNDNPLIPTADLPKDESNYGKVTIAPPEGEDMPPTKFLNLNPEEDSSSEEEEPISKNDPLLNMSPITENIKEQKQEKQESFSTGFKPIKDAELDNLLSMGNPTSSTPSNSYITPAEKIVKQDPQMDWKKDLQSDYFNASDISAIHIAPEELMNTPEEVEEEPEETQEENGTSSMMMPIIDNPEIPEEEQNEDTEMNLENAIDKIRNMVGELQAKGLNINIDEMNFDKTYQFIIKIQKEPEE